MFKNRFLVVIGVISLLSVTLAVSGSRHQPAPVADLAGSDFYQRHPDWTWTIRDQNAIPVTGDSAFPDYYQRHLELRNRVIPGLTASDYFQRHPELTAPLILSLGASDYFQRHPDLTLSAATAVDLTDYFFRHPASQSSSRNVDLTDYYFRHA